VRSTGHGFCGIGRKHLLNILQDRCLELGVELVFETDVTDDQALAAQYNADLVIASDGLNSRIRTRYAETFQPDIDTRDVPLRVAGHAQDFRRLHLRVRADRARLVPGPCLQVQRRTPRPSSSRRRRRSGRPMAWTDMSQEEGIAFCERLFAKYLDGHALISNAKHLRGSANWIRFPR
jgi:anthraniloyl-CoA monooxygenase